MYSVPQFTEPTPFPVLFAPVPRGHFPSPTFHLRHREMGFGKFANPWWKVLGTSPGAQQALRGKDSSRVLARKRSASSSQAQSSGRSGPALRPPGSPAPAGGVGGGATLPPSYQRRRPRGRAGRGGAIRGCARGPSIHCIPPLPRCAERATHPLWTVSTVDSVRCAGPLCRPCPPCARCCRCTTRERRRRGGDWRAARR